MINANALRSLTVVLVLGAASVLLWPSTEAQLSTPATPRDATAFAAAADSLIESTLGKLGTVPGLAVASAEIELDVETGKHEIVEYLAVGECGTVVHPLGLAQQLKGGGVWGFGMASLERHVYDPQNGLPANVALYQCKPPGYLDAPRKMDWGAVEIADPQNPAGARGLGEPVMGAAAGALLSALSDALGGHMFNRAPVTTDMILNAASARDPGYKALRINSQ